MPDAPVLETLRVQVSGTAYSEIWANAFAVQWSTPGPLQLTDANDIAVIFSQFYMAAPPVGSGWGTYRAAASFLTDITIYDWRTVPNPAPFEFSFNLQGEGTGTENLESAAVVTWQTGIGGQTGRGRTFLGPLAVAAIDSGSATVPPQLNANAVAAFATAADSLGTKLIANASPLAVYSPTFGLSRLVNGGRVDRKIDVQRRRGDDISVGAPATFLFT